jgi:formate hydrogenlyase transcriptional activator
MFDSNRKVLNSHSGRERAETHRRPSEQGLEGRASKMLSTNCDCLDRHSDSAGLKAVTDRAPAISGLIGSSPNFLEVVEQLRTVAAAHCAVLIRGETGTGKEVIARGIHDASTRRQQRFVAINCSAIPAPLIESELFGHERGAFTGALTNRIGRFQSADGGTLFLDEIGELPIELQPKLLRAIQQQEFEKVGSSQTTRVDVRIIAATNQNLEEMVAERRFRKDLYYRLNVFPIWLPPLRERASDIPLLIDHFLRTIGGRYGKSIDLVSDDVMTAIMRYDWPGNIRELQNFIERSLILTNGRELRAPIAELTNLEARGGVVRTLNDAHRALIIKTLRETGWVVGGPSGAAAKLGLKRTTLITKMRRLGISTGPDKPVKGTSECDRDLSPVSSAAPV